MIKFLLTNEKGITKITVAVATIHALFFLFTSGSDWLSKLTFLGLSLALCFIAYFFFRFLRFVETPVGMDKIMLVICFTFCIIFLVAYYGQFAWREGDDRFLIPYVLFGASVAMLKNVKDKMNTPN